MLFPASPVGRRLSFAVLMATWLAAPAAARAQVPAAPPGETVAPAAARPAGEPAPAPAPAPSEAVPPAPTPPASAAAAPSEPVPPPAALSPAPPPPVVAAPPPAPVEPSEDEPPARDRPRLEVAIGYGGSIDGTGLAHTGTTVLPAFFAMAGFGDGLVGFDVGVFSNNATGRFQAPDIPVDRIGLDAMLAVRPWVRHRPRDTSHHRHDTGYRPPAAEYGLRVLRTLAADVGFGVERLSRISGGPQAAERVGLRVGGHVDLPLLPAANAARSDLRLRLGVRRLIGISTATFPNGGTASDTRAELFSALVVVF
jgi:hypothetical protein